jgi:hypothetical protein
MIATFEAPWIRLWQLTEVGSAMALGVWDISRHRSPIPEFHHPCFN